jgi:hypothetical protein
VNWLDRAVPATLSPKEIDLDDRSFLIPCYDDLQPLITSIERVGVLHHIYVQKTADQRLIPALGRRRLKAALAIGLTSITVRVIYASADEADLFRTAFWDNITLRRPNPTFTAIVANRILELFPLEVALGEFFPILGVSSDGIRLRRLQAVAGLEEPILEALAGGRMHEKTAVILAGMEPGARLRLFELTLALRLNANKSAEVIGTLFDLSVSKACGVNDLLERNEARAVLDDPETSAPEKASRFRELLGQWKFPELTADEREFNERFQGLASDKRVSVRPTPFFEDKRCTIEIRAESWEEAESILQAIPHTSH